MLGKEIRQWALEFTEFRQRLFLLVVEPVIVAILRPFTVEQEGASSLGDHQPPVTEQTTVVSFAHSDETHRRLGFLPSYVEDVSSYRETSMSFATLSMLFVIMSCLALVFLSCFYHNQKTSPLFISPRRHRLPKLVPPPLPVDGTFSWIRVCFYMSDEEIINRIGYDALIFLRFHRLALRCIVKMGIFSFVVLLPLNFTGGGHANASDLKGYVGSLLFTDFLRFTMANVIAGSPRLWVHCAAAYLLTAIVVRELLVEYNAFNNIRHRYLLSKEPHLRTVLVTNIPRHLRAPSKISTYFRHVYPEAVKAVTICQNLIHLESLVVKRNLVLTKIEKELLILCRNEKRKLLGQSNLRAIAPLGCCEKIGFVDGAQERLAKLYNKLEFYNDKVRKELERRRKVMKKMDTLNAGVGRKDIDYILASPFESDSSNVLNSAREDIAGRLSLIGAPRNSDGTTEKPQYIPPSYQNPQSIASSGTAISGTHSNATAQRRFATNAISKSGSDIDVPECEYVASVPPQMATSGPMPVVIASEAEDANGMTRPFAKAKSAIKRYSRLGRDVGFLGRPKRSPSDKAASQADRKRNTLGFIEDHINEVTDKAFVVMRTFTASTIAIQSMHSSKPGAMQVTTAPEPRDILWENIYVSKGAKKTRSYIADTIVILLIAFYVVPVALVSLLVSESALVSFSPRLAQLDQASAFFSTAIAMVQPLCLVGIQQLLPPLFLTISKAEGLVAFSEAMMKSFSRYFMFQVLNVFLVTAIAGSIFDTLAIIIENPEAAFEMLGNSLPKMSSFFITFVTMKTFLGLGVELVRTMSIIQASVRYIIFPNSTLRAQRGVRLGMRAIDDPGWFPFHKILAQDMLVVVISVVFAVIAPIVLLPCAIFCLFSRIMWTHHHLYVYESIFETGGLFWPKIFRRFVFGLIIAQMTITGQFILKEARHEAYATMALMFLTYFFLRSTRARYDSASSTLPLEVATVMDITVSQEEEAQRQMQAEEARLKGYDNGSDPHRRVKFKDMSTASVMPETNTTRTTADDFLDEFGTVIGTLDPFEHAYVQPALRSAPHARPEQPFPPSQLGREEIFFGEQGVMTDEEAMDDSATVRLKSLNQQDRALINRWWSDQLQRCGEQNTIAVLVGEESGRLMVGQRASFVQNGHYV